MSQAPTAHPDPADRQACDTCAHLAHGYQYTHCGRPVDVPGEISEVDEWMARWDPRPQSGKMPGKDAHGCPGWSRLAVSAKAGRQGDG